MIQIRGILLKQLISHSINNIPVVHNLLNVLYFGLILETFSPKKRYNFFSTSWNYGGEFYLQRPETLLFLKEISESKCAWRNMAQKVIMTVLLGKYLRI